MENILDMIILITLSGWLTTFLIKEKIEGESKVRIKIIIKNMGQLHFWGMIISFFLFLFLSNNGFFD